ncbi:acyltransferase [Ulvibacter litoralis]|uniref:Polymorphic outer membrane protein repeat-containing protein n=1 Tax=Ulvibacter litoralis TaxID=227084 RepID=A0A1G7HLY9_9FLAO|nr:acyltransferase [Ulvibacter litoralis]GHC58343.1 acetyltransferase [Ulvibacter litoralis]SDF01490.1 polymorphic outer membrane protein repeat-containing protein [Ulvibacter litoralis]
MNGTLKLFLKRIINHVNHFRFRNKVTTQGSVDFGYTSRILLCNGSKKQDIILKHRSRMYASLVSKFGGKIIFEENVKIGYGSVIACTTSITIGKGTAIAHNVTIIDNNNHPTHPEDRKLMYNSPWDSPLRNWNYSKSAPISIGENVWVGTGSRIHKGVTIGDNSIIAANAMVTKNVPANSIVAGNPAKVVKENIQNEPRLIMDNE